MGASLLPPLACPDDSVNLLHCFGVINQLIGASFTSFFNRNGLNVTSKSLIGFVELAGVSLEVAVLEGFNEVFGLKKLAKAAADFLVAWDETVRSWLVQQ